MVRTRTSVLGKCYCYAMIVKNLWWTRSHLNEADEQKFRSPTDYVSLWLTVYSGSKLSFHTYSHVRWCGISMHLHILAKWHLSKWSFRITYAWGSHWSLTTGPSMMKGFRNFGVESASNAQLPSIVSQLNITRSINEVCPAVLRIQASWRAQLKVWTAQEMQTTQSWCVPFQRSCALLQSVKLRPLLLEWK